MSRQTLITCFHSLAVAPWAICLDTECIKICIKLSPNSLIVTTNQCDRQWRQYFANIAFPFRYFIGRNRFLRAWCRGLFRLFKPVAARVFDDSADPSRPNRRRKSLLDSTVHSLIVDLSMLFLFDNSRRKKKSAWTPPPSTRSSFRRGVNRTERVTHCTKVPPILAV